MAAGDRGAPRPRRGLSIRNLQFVMACMTLVISVALLFATFSAKTGYSTMRRNTEEYIQWERDVNDLQSASDYLTEQVRCFVETGKRDFLDNYFKEAEVTRRREHALESMQGFLGDSPAYQSLQRAMDESVALMDREYYAMRLTIAAYGYDFTAYPAAIRRVELSEEDALLPPERQEALARSKVFDDVYHLKKQSISDNVQSCLDTLADEIGQRQVKTADGLNDILSKQRILIIAAIFIILFTILLTMQLVIGPLLRAVVFIRADEPIPIRGSKEFQFLARTYNLMYEANREQKEHLAYEATHDPLTGIYNRSGYDFFLNNVDWTSSCLLLFDVDKFKQINDSYGHEMGDRILQRVASTIRDSFRSQDFACRIGGDEFAVIMVHTMPDNAELVQRKVESINRTLRVEKDGLPPIHVSCGAAYGADGEEYQQIFQGADNALYSVKRSGGCGCAVNKNA
ncbi:MAG: GGDEF domain-containing protein [Clostridia bacterium]|nr:GGDEF domain-containing protein [Clostridia bacterium]